MCSGHVTVDMNAHRMQLIRVADHLGVRLPATPPPQALDDEELFVIKGSENWRSTPDKPEEREKWPKGRLCAD